MDLLFFTDLATGPRSNLVQWLQGGLQGRALLPNPLHCATCDRDMELKQRNGDHIDGFIW